jgi:hypothetical protein
MRSFPAQVGGRSGEVEVWELGLVSSYVSCSNTEGRWGIRVAEGWYNEGCVEGLSERYGRVRLINKRGVQAS